MSMVFVKLKDSGTEVARAYGMRIVLVLMCAGSVAMCSAAGAGDVDHVRGVVTEIHSREFVLVTEDRKSVVVDMSELGGTTMALATGQSIVAIGTMAPGGNRFHAVRLETPSAHPEPSATP